MLIVANARNFGGAFRIAPHASLTDGALDAISIHDASALRRLKLFGAVRAAPTSASRKSCRSRLVVHDSTSPRRRRTRRTANTTGRPPPTLEIALRAGRPAVAVPADAAG
jgi:hypothetical protein